ncbi:MAG: cytochrome c oxidase subunit II [Pseudomonadota bacterium]
MMKQVGTGLSTVFWTTMATAMLFAFPAAAVGVGQPENGQLGMQMPVTEVARGIVDFHDFVNYIIIAITLFVLVLMIYVMWRFSEKNNPTPSRTTHNTFVEIVWTVVPIIILVIIAVPSFKLLNLQYAFPKPDLTIKATGYQWYWVHSYPDYGDFEFETYMLDEDGLQERRAAGLPAPRNLAVDNEVLVPVNKNVHVLVTAGDVLHNWTIPAFGTKTDSVPGRITATWFKAEREGVFYGQCSELCGVNHAFMPIAVRVVSQDKFDSWVKAMEEGDTDAAEAIVRQAALEHAGKNQVALTDANKDKDAE